VAEYFFIYMKAKQRRRKRSIVEDGVGIRVRMVGSYVDSCGAILT
jgi:hypothetical protein